MEISVKEYSDKLDMFERQLIRDFFDEKLQRNDDETRNFIAESTQRALQHVAIIASFIVTGIDKKHNDEMIDCLKMDLEDHIKIRLDILNDTIGEHPTNLN